MKECKEVENEVRISLDLTEVKLGFDHLKNIYFYCPKENGFVLKYKQSREVLFTASTMLLDINEVIAPIREEQERLVIKWKMLSSLLSSKNEDLGAELHGKVQLWFNFREGLRLGIRSLIQGCSPYNKGNFIPSLTADGLTSQPPFTPLSWGCLDRTPGISLASWLHHMLECCSSQYQEITYCHFLESGKNCFFMLLGLSARVTKSNMFYSASE